MSTLGTIALLGAIACGNSGGDDGAETLAYQESRAFAQSACSNEDIECNAGLATPPASEPATVLLAQPAGPLRGGRAQHFGVVPLAQALPANVQTAAEVLPGTMSISQSGRAIYSLPLQLAIGVNNLKPALELRYRGTKTNGFLGSGWQVTGFSSISRCPLTTGQDDVAAPISDTASDRFCLDGQRLIAIQGPYGSDGTEYRTEIESFARVFSRGDPGNPANYVGPASFEVWTPDGRITRYGTGTGTVEMSRTVRRTWGISTASDRFNNIITYTYSTQICDPPELDTPPICFGTGLVPREISYGAHQAGTGTDTAIESDRKVRFVYSTDRNDWETNFERGVVRVLRQRLDSIEMVVAGATAWSYELRYSLLGGLSHLMGVQRCAAGSPSLCTLESKFDYIRTTQATNRTAIAADTVVFDFGNGPHSMESGRTVVLDANGDGLDDILTPKFASRPNGVPHFTYQLLLGQSGEVPLRASIDTLIPSGISGGVLPDLPCFSQESVVDFNRDGKDDLLDLCMNSRAGWRIFLSTGDGFTIQLLPFISTQFYSTTPMRVADFDGDGWFDLLTCEGGSFLRHYVLYRNRGGTDGFFPARDMPQLGRDCDRTAAVLLDTDGDGVVNVFRPARNPRQETRTFGLPFEVAPPWKSLVLTNSTASWVDVPMTSFPPKWISDDFHLDIEDDFTLNLEYHGGDTPVTPLSPLWQYKVMDYNGDGLADLLTFQGDATPVTARTSLYVNTGAGFTRVAFALGQTHSIDNYSFYRATVIDWDGDGRQDLLIPVGDPRRSPQMILFRSVGRGGPFVSSAIGGTIDVYGLPVVMDFDGDGDGDLVIPETEETLSFIRSTTNDNHLLNDIENGLGRRDHVSYARGSFNNTAAYSFTANCITRNTQCARRVAPLVAEASVLQRKQTPDGGTAYTQIRRSTYTYRDARSGLYGRGGLGFNRLTRFDDEPGGKLADTVTTTLDNSTFFASITGTTARRLYPFAGQPTGVRTTHGAVSDLSDLPSLRTKIVDYRPLAVQISSDGRPFVVAANTVTHTTEGPPGETAQILLRVAESRSYDDYGNVISETAEWRNGVNQVLETRQSTSTFATDTPGRANWLIRCPLTQSETSRVGGVDQTRTTSDDLCVAPNVISRRVREPQSTDSSLFLATQYDYDRFGNLTRVTASDHSGDAARINTYDYDSRGLTMIRKVEGGRLSTILAIDPIHGGTISETAPNGITQTTRYDALSRPADITSPNGTTTFSYDMATSSQFDTIVALAGRMRLRKTDPGGDQSDRILDALGRVIQTRATGYFGTVVTQETDYDFAGRTVFQSAPHLVGDSQQGSVRFEYDRLGRLRFARQTDESAPGGVRVTQLRYGPASQAGQVGWDSTTKMNTIGVVQQTDSSGRSELRGIGYFGQTVVSRDALSNVTQAMSSTFGVPKQLRDAAGNLTEFQHDVLGRRTVLTDSTRGTEETSYDAFDAPLTTNDATGVTRYAYDVLGRLTSRTDSDGTLRTYRYDGTGTKQGQLVEATTKNAAGATTTRIAYDYQPVSASGAGQLAVVARTVGTVTFETRADYDSFGRLITLTYPAADGTAFAVRNSYDDRGHLTAVTDPTTGVAYWSITAADQGYRISRETLGDGTETRWAYQPLGGRLTGVETRRRSDPAVVVQQLSYDYDMNGELMVRSDGLAPTRSRAYEYDLLDRLTRVVQRHGTGAATELERLAYDSLGNIISRSSIGAYVYGSASPHAVTAAGANTYAYDVRGNQRQRIGPSVTGGRQEISYTPFNLPTRIVTGIGAAEKTTDYTYDADQRRAYAVTSEGTQTWYVDELYEREQTPTSISHRYRVYGPGKVVAEIVRQQATSGQPLSPPVQRYIHVDGLGSPDLVMDGSGAVVSRPLFEPFGNLVTGTPDVVTGFTGQRQEAVGLIDMRGRFYDPALARFLSPDPLVSDPFSSQALNRYSYVHNRPLRLTDPSGFDPVTLPSQVDPSLKFCSECYVILDAHGNIMDGPGGPGDGTESSGNQIGGASTPTSGADGAQRSARASSPAGSTSTGGSGGSGGQPASVGVAIAASAGGLAVGAGVATAITYGLGLLSAACAPCAVGVGLGLAAIAIYHLIDGGGASLYNSGSRIVHGDGTASDYFSVSSVAGSLGAASISSRAFASGRSSGMALRAAMASRVAGGASRATSLASMLEGHGPGQGFTGVFDAATGRVALRPSTGEAVVPRGWVTRRGGHGPVSAELGGDTANHLGFAAILQEGGSLQLTWRSGTLNPAPGYVVPFAFRSAIVQAVEQLTGRAVTSW